MNNTSVAIINSKAPFALSHGKEALDLALIFGSYEQEVALFFIGDGVWQLAKNTDGEKLSVKDYLKTFDALPFYDVEQIFVCEQSLKDRNLEHIKQLDGLSILDSKAFATQIANYQHALRF